MTKEPHQPKAVNIIRPSNNYLNHSLSHSSSGSTTSTNSQRRSTVSSTSSNTNRKPRVTATNVIKPLEKPHLNLYHPPVRKPSYDNNKSPSSSSRPPIEIYKPQQPPLQLQQQHQQQRIMTKSMTVPLNLNYHEPPKLIHSRPMSPSYIRSSPQQQPQQYHRSVLGIINTPVVATTTTTTTIPSIIHSDTPSLPEMIDTNTTTSSSSSSLVSVNQEEDQDVNLEENELDDDDEVEEEEEEPVITEARVNRKIADLELSIKSLLTVNAMLEATVRKQATQLNQIKKQRLGEHDLISDDIVDSTETNDPLDEDHEEEEDWEKDLLFQKLRKITEHMIEQGQKSIDFEYKILGRVLSNYTPEEDDEEDEDTKGTDSSITEASTTETIIPMTKSSIPRKNKKIVVMH